MMRGSPMPWDAASVPSAGIRMYRSAALSTGNASVLTNVGWDAESIAPIGSMKSGFAHSISSDNELITCTLAGTYHLSGGVKASASATQTSLDAQVEVLAAADAGAGYVACNKVTMPAGARGLLDENSGAGSAVLSFITKLEVGGIVCVRVASNGQGSRPLVVDELTTWLDIRALA